MRTLVHVFHGRSSLYNTMVFSLYHLASRWSQVWSGEIILCRASDSARAV